MKKWLSVPLAGFFVALSASASIACPALQPDQSMDEKYAQHEAVFFGRVEEVNDEIIPGDLTEQRFTVHDITVTFKILHVWKGEAKKTFELHYSWTQDTCGIADLYAFEQGMSYVVFAPLDSVFSGLRMIERVGKEGLCPADATTHTLDRLSGKKLAEDEKQCSQGVPHAL